MNNLTINEMIESIENKITVMQNEAFYETEENDFETQLNIYKSHMVQISAELSVLKDINNGFEVVRKGN
jgi:hypothetical protein